MLAGIDDRLKLYAKKTIKKGESNFWRSLMRRISDFEKLEKIDEDNQEEALGYVTRENVILVAKYYAGEINMQARGTNTNAARVKQLFEKEKEPARRALEAIVLPGLLEAAMTECDTRAVNASESDFWADDDGDRAAMWSERYEAIDRALETWMEMKEAAAKRDWGALEPAFEDLLEIDAR